MISEWPGDIVGIRNPDCRKAQVMALAAGDAWLSQGANFLLFSACLVTARAIWISARLCAD